MAGFMCASFFQWMDDQIGDGWWFEQAVAHHKVLSLPFLDHVVVVLNQVPLFRDDDVDKADSSERLSLPPHTLSQRPQAATLALGAILRYNITYPSLSFCHLYLVVDILHRKVGTQALTDQGW
jgi:hypothetical protein